MAEWKSARDVFAGNPDISLFTKSAGNVALKEGNNVNPSRCSEDLLDIVITADNSPVRKSVLGAFTTREDLEDFRPKRQNGRLISAAARVACIEGCKGVVLMNDGSRKSFCKNKADESHSDSDT